MTWPDDLEMASAGTISAVLKFVVKDCDPDTGLPDSDEGYDDEYALEDIDINLSDHMVGVSRPNFAASWEELQEEREEAYALSSADSIPEAVKNIVNFLGIQPCDRTDRVPEGKSSHVLALAGKMRFLSSSSCLCRSSFDVTLFFAQVCFVAESRYLPEPSW